VGAAEPQPLRFRVYVARGTPLHALLSALPPESRGPALVRLAEQRAASPDAHGTAGGSTDPGDLAQAVAELAQAVRDLSAAVTALAGPPRDVGQKSGPEPGGPDAVADPRVESLHSFWDS